MARKTPLSVGGLGLYYQNFRGKVNEGGFSGAWLPKERLALLHNAISPQRLQQQLRPYLREAETVRNAVWNLVMDVCGGRNDRLRSSRLAALQLPEFFEEKGFLFAPGGLQVVSEVRGDLQDLFPIPTVWDTLEDQYHYLLHREIEDELAETSREGLIAILFDIDQTMRGLKKARRNVRARRRQSDQQLRRQVLRLFREAKEIYQCDIGDPTGGLQQMVHRQSLQHFHDGQRIILCSAPIFDQLRENEEMAAIFREVKSARKAARELVQQTAGKEKSPQRKSLAAIVVDLTSEEVPDRNKRVFSSLR